MSPSELAKIQRFIEDRVMAQAVKDVLKEAFTAKSMSNEVMYLAASRIAIDLLEDAWRKLEMTGRLDEKPERGGTNPGV